jgi:deoxycytidylate deaminase
MTPNCCPECAKAIVQAGIKNVHGYASGEISPRWQDLSKFSNSILNEGGVKFICEETEE